MDPLETLVSSRVRRGILARVYLSPEREFYLRELVRLTTFAPRSVQLELDRLVRSDLLTERRDGNRRYVKANEAHPLFSLVRDVLTRTEGLVGVLRDALGTRGIDLALVFGSMAAGAPKAGSDVDLLIVGTLGLKGAVKRLRPAADHLGREINPVVWTGDEFERRRRTHDHFLSTVLKGPTIMISGTLHDA